MSPCALRRYAILLGMTVRWNLLPKLALELSGGSKVRQLRLCIELYFFCIARSLWHANKRHLLRFCHNGMPASLFVWSTDDIIVLMELYVWKEYDLQFTAEPSLIIDIGAHTGNTALYFHSLFHKAVIYAVEASPASFSKLKENVQGIEKIVPVHAALAEKEGIMHFFESAHSIGSSLLQRSKQDEQVEVPSLSMRAFFAAYGLKKADFIKIDIEGGEERLFRNDPPETFSDAYMLEVHGDLMRMAVGDFTQLFSRMQIHADPIPGAPQRSLLKARTKNSTFLF